MSLNERLEFLLHVNAEGAIKGFKAVGDEAEHNLTRAQGGIQKTGATMTKVGAGMVVGAGLIGVGLLDLSKKWEESALSAGKLSAATGLTVDEASRWSVVAKGADVDTATLTTSLGKMDKAIEKTPGQFSALGAEIVRTKSGAVDTSATFLNVVDALNAAGGAANNANTATAILGKGWQGMSEILNKSSDDLKTRLADVNKAQIFNEGDVHQAEQFRDTMKELSNTAQGLALSIGKSAAPVMADFASALSHVVEWGQKANDATGGMVGKFAAIGAAGIGALGTMSLIAGQAIKMSARFTTVGEDGERSLTRIGSAAKGLGIAMGVAGIALAAYSLQQKLNADNAAAAAKGLDQVTKGADDQAQAIVGGLIGAWERFKDMKPEDAVKKLAETNLEATVRTRDMATADADFAAQLEKRGVTVAMLTTAIDAQVATEKQQKAQADESAAAVDNLAASTDGLTASTDNSQNSMTGYSYAVQDIKRSTDDAATAVTEWERHNKSMTDDLARGLATDKSAMDNLLGVVNDDEAWLNLQNNFAATAALFDDKGNVIVKKGADAAQAMRDAALAVDGLKKNVIDYGTSVLGLPVERITKIVAAVDPQSLADVNALLDNLTRNRNMSVSIVAKGGAGYAATPQFAKGGTVPGPKGAPLLAVVHGGEQVISNEQQASGTGLGSLTVNVTVQGSVMTERDLVRTITDGIIDAQARGEIPTALVSA